MDFTTVKCEVLYVEHSSPDDSLHCGSSDPWETRGLSSPAAHRVSREMWYNFCTVVQTGWCFSSQASPWIKSTDHVLEGHVQALPERNLSSSLTPGQNLYCGSERRWHPPCMFTGHLVLHSARWLSNNLIERFHWNYRKPKCSSDNQGTCTSSGAKGSGLGAQTWFELCQTHFFKHAAAFSCPKQAWEA